MDEMQELTSELKRICFCDLSCCCCFCDPFRLREFEKLFEAGFA